MKLKSTSKSWNSLEQASFYSLNCWPGNCTYAQASNKNHKLIQFTVHTNLHFYRKVNKINLPGEGVITGRCNRIANMKVLWEIK